MARILGLLLIGAAGLKIYGLGVQPVAGIGIFSAPEFQVALIEFEIALSICLLWGARPILSWLIALITFAGFAAASLFLAAIGQSSCGCFGALVSVSPISIRLYWIASS